MRLSARLSRVMFISVWVFVLFLIATNIQAGWLYVVIAVFIILVLVSLVFPGRMIAGLKVDMTLPEYTERGTETNGKLRLENPSRRRRYMVRVECAGTDFEFAPLGAVFVTVPPHSTMELPVKFRCHRRGGREVGRLVLTCGAPVAIFYSRREAPCGASTIVHPALRIVRGEAPDREFSMHDAGPMQKKIAFQDPYHYSLREYSPGDSLRSMHWKLTARRDEPIMRVHERKIFGQAAIVVDNVRANWPKDGDEMFERVLERALAATHHLLFDSGYVVTLAGTAAPVVTIENETAWETALHWFAMIDLADYAERVDGFRADDFMSGGDVELFFGAEQQGVVSSK